MQQRLLVIGLDGFEQTVAGHLIAAGECLHLKALMADSARFALDHGKHRRTGLAWEHVSTGQSPDESGRYAAVTFDPSTYAADQRATTLAPFLAGSRRNVVAIDVPYFDLQQAFDVRGISSWGAHDPGVPPFARPSTLAADLHARIGPYPASDEIYAFAWPSSARAKEVGAKLSEAVHTRCALTQWILQDRLPNWDLAITVVSELHSGVEPLWHGFDEDHPLHDHSSAAAARQGLFDIYRALDDFVGTLRAAFPDAAIMAFSMHGMGANDADVASMVLLPELLYRRAFGTSKLVTPQAWRQAPGGLPILSEAEHWDRAVLDCLKPEGLVSRALRKARRHGFSATPLNAANDDGRTDFPIAWMPSSRYAPHWKDMTAFAIPSFYDGRIRLNVAGREAAGFVSRDDYAATCDAVIDDLLACRCSRTGAPVVRDVLRPHGDDPMAVPPTDGDLEVVWDGLPIGFDHPRYGQIGPVPIRRTGGHTGGDGALWICSDDIAPGDHGRRSAFDVAPTIHDWIGSQAEPPASGESLIGTTGLASAQPLAI